MNTPWLTAPKTIVMVLACACLIPLAPRPAIATDDYPRADCVGGICLGVNVTEYESMVDRVGMNFFGPIATLKDDGKFVSPNPDDFDAMNYVIFNGCNNPGAVRTIHRVVPDEDPSQILVLLAAYKQRFGTPDVPMWADSDDFYLWEWDNPTTTLILRKGNGIKYIQISLHNKEQAELDNACIERELVAKKEAEGLVPTSRSAGAEPEVETEKGDVYRPVYYPNKNDLTKYLRGPRFGSLEEARQWVRDQHASGLDPDWDYEIGKNCRPSDFGDIEICEETTK